MSETLRTPSGAASGSAPEAHQSEKAPSSPCSGNLWLCQPYNVRVSSVSADARWRAGRAHAGHDQERAVAFLTDNLDQVASYSDSLQLIVLELIRKVVRTNPLDKSKYIRCILTLFNSPSSAVTYECASVLIALSSSATAIRAAASSYTTLLASQSDNNIKLIVLERLQDLKKQHPKVRRPSLRAAPSVGSLRLFFLRAEIHQRRRLAMTRRAWVKQVVTELIMDVLRALASANLDIRKKTLDITLDLSLIHI